MLESRFAIDWSIDDVGPSGFVLADAGEDRLEEVEDETDIEAAWLRCEEVSGWPEEC